MEDLKFLPSGELLAGYYGGVSIWSPEVGEQGIELPFTVSPLARVTRTEAGRFWLQKCQRGCAERTKRIERKASVDRPCGNAAQGNFLSVSASEDRRWIIGGCHDATGITVWKRSPRPFPRLILNLDSMHPCPSS